MEIFSNPDISIIVSFISLILAIIGIYISLNNTDKKSLFFMHFENTQIFSPEILKETELVKTLDDRLEKKGLNKLVVYLSNDCNKVIELSDWSNDFKLTFEDKETEIQEIKFFSTNRNSLIDNRITNENSLSFRVGEFEPDDIVKAEIKYISKEPQKGHFEFKLRGRKKEEDKFHSDHKIIEHYAESKYFNSSMLGFFPIILGILYFSLYHILLACFKIKTMDLINFYKTESITEILIVSAILLLLMTLTVPLVIKIHDAFVPFYRKLKKIKDYYEII